MPLYEYVCTQCHRRCEIIQKVNDPPPKSCKVCGGAMKKVVSAPAIQFKGSGWYITDYAKKSTPERSEKPHGKAAGKVESCQNPGDDKKAPPAADKN